jgi:hypothetical protein
VRTVGAGALSSECMWYVLLHGHHLSVQTMYMITNGPILESDLGMGM